MKLTKIFSNLYDYNVEGLETVEIDGGSYRTFTDFKPSVIFGMTFGKDCSSGSCNESLGRAVYDARNFFEEGRQDRIYTISQREVYDSFIKTLGKDDENSFGVCKSLEAKTTLNTDVTTLDAFEEGKEIIIKKGIDPSRILYVAHPAHMFRVLEMGKKIYTPQGSLEGKPFMQTDFSYNPADDQKFVRDAKSYARREFLVRVHHKIKGIL